MKKLSYKILYTLWAVMFALTAVLGFFFPSVEETAPRLLLQFISVLFFLPPWLIVAKAKEQGSRKHLCLVRYLSIASIVLTAVLLCANIACAGAGEALGIALNAALTIISAPMVCSNLFVLPLFLWGTLLMGTFGKK